MQLYSWFIWQCIPIVSELYNYLWSLWPHVLFRMSSLTAQLPLWVFVNNFFNHQKSFKSISNLFVGIYPASIFFLLLTCFFVSILVAFLSKKNSWWQSFCSQCIQVDSCSMHGSTKRKETEEIQGSQKHRHFSLIVLFSFKTWRMKMPHWSST